jgi:hypothetical protein
MRKELGLLNIICILVALGFLGMAIVSVISSGDFLTIDNLFIITVSVFMALMFAINPLLYLKSEGRLPLPFSKKAIAGPASDSEWGQIRSQGRAVPPDVRAIVSRMESHKEAQKVQ